MEAGQEEEPEVWNMSPRLGSERKHLCCNQRVAAGHGDVPGRALKAVWGSRERGSIKMWCSEPAVSPAWDTAEMLQCSTHSVPLISAAGNWLYGLQQEPGSSGSLKVLTPKISWQKTVGSSAGGVPVWLHFPGHAGSCGALELPQVATGVGTFGEEMDPQKSLDQEVKRSAWLVLEGRRKIVIWRKDSTWIPDRSSH